MLSNLNDLDGAIVRPLYDLALREGDDDAASQALRSLASLEGPDSARRLADVLNDPSRSAQVRSEAASGLRDLGGPLARANRASIAALAPPTSENDWVCGAAQ